eukprot:760415-Hanusia_phi.AAC.3
MQQVSVHRELEPIVGGRASEGEVQLEAAAGFVFVTSVSTSYQREVEKDASASELQPEDAEDNDELGEVELTPKKPAGRDSQSIQRVCSLPVSMSEQSARWQQRYADASPAKVVVVQEAENSCSPDDPMIAAPKLASFRRQRVTRISSHATLFEHASKGQVRVRGKVLVFPLARLIGQETIAEAGSSSMDDIALTSGTVKAILQNAQEYMAPKVRDADAMLTDIEGTPAPAPAPAPAPVSSSA